MCIYTGTLDRYDGDAIKELIDESLVMKDLDHPNVMGLIGICLDAGPSPLIILPYMEGRYIEEVQKNCFRAIFLQVVAC